MANIIFYFSATGNSYSVAKSLAERISDTVLAPLLKAKEYKTMEYGIIGIVMPVYYTHAPDVALKALSDIEFQSSKQIFAVTTYGASWGYALQDIRTALNNTNVILQEYKVKMPGNYILEYGAYPQPYQNHVLKRAEIQVRKIAECILNNEKTEHIKPNLLATLFRRRADKQRNLFSKLGSEFFVTENCCRCSQCVELCPVKNITISDSNVIWENKCTQCMACIQWCPQKAISHPLMKNNRLRYTHPNVVAKQIGGAI